MKTASTGKTLDARAHTKFSKLIQGLSGTYALISQEPLIFHVARSRNPVSEFDDSYKFLFNRLQGRPVYFLCVWYWHIEEPVHVEIVKRLEEDLLRRYPNFKFIHLGNTERQVETFRNFDLDAVFCNQNCVLDERIFKPMSGIRKQYDAVYDARFIEFKRHYLASRIDSIGLIYAQNHYSEEDWDFFSKTKSEFDRARFFNRTDSVEYQHLHAEDIAKCLNECRVGLCLSAEEGAMYASAQYLLCGLPVVSTKSLGGRDVFFDDRYVSVVDATPEAVRHGVDDLIGRNISADAIRENTLEKMRTHRQTFISLVQDIYDREGVARTFQNEWDAKFFNKMLRSQSHVDTLKRIANS